MDSSLDKFDAVYLSGKCDKSIDVIATGKAEAQTLTADAMTKATAEARADFDGRDAGRFDALDDATRELAVHAHLGRQRMGRYIKTRDIDLLCFEGEPARFEIQRPDPIWLAEEAGAVAHMAARQTLAFRTLVHTIRRGNQVLIEATKPERKGEHTLIQTSTGAWLAPPSFTKAVQKMFSSAVILEMGQVALDFAELSEEQQAPFGFWGGSVARPSVLG